MKTNYLMIVYLKAIVEHRQVTHCQHSKLTPIKMEIDTKGSGQMGTKREKAHITSRMVTSIQVFGSMTREQVKVFLPSPVATATRDNSRTAR